MSEIPWLTPCSRWVNVLPGYLIGLLVLTLLMNARDAGAQTTRVVRTVSEPVFEASLAEITPQWQVAFRHALSQRKIPVRDLVSWGEYHERIARAHVVLDSGTVVVGDVTAIRAEGITFSGQLWPETQIPLRRVRGVVFRPPLDLLERDRLFAHVRDADRQDDQLLLDNGDHLSGQLELPAVPPEGALQLSSFPSRVPRASQTLPVPAARVVALLLRRLPAAPAVPDAVDGSHADAARREHRVLVGFSDGSRLLVEKIERAGNALQVSLADGLELNCERALPASAGPWQDVVFLQPLAGRATYLSDLEPLGHKLVPLFDLDWPFGRDVNVAGGRLRHAGAVYMKGIGMHSTARLAYELPEPFQWFEAELAIDDRAGRNGSVVFRVYTQAATGGWSKAYESEIVRGAAPLVAMRADIRNAVRLALIVDSADRTDVWDHANWLNARLVKE